MNDVNRAGEHQGHQSAEFADRRVKLKSSHSQFLPTLLIGVAVLSWTFFKTVELVKEHHLILAVQAAQRPQIMSSQKLRATLNALAINLKQLADKGDSGAQTIVTALGKRGITIHRHQKHNGIQ